MYRIWAELKKRPEKILYFNLRKSLLISGKKEGIVLIKCIKSDNKIFLKVKNRGCKVWINEILIQNHIDWLIEPHDSIKIFFAEKCIYQECKNEEEIKLPFVNPCVKTYPYFTALVGILGAYRKEEVWIFNNYILLWMFRFIHFNEYWCDFKYGNEEIQAEFCVQIRKKVEHREKVSDIIIFIEEAILKKCYIFLSIDRFYLNEYWDDDERTHTKHQVLINGYNREKKYFLVTDFFANGKYKTIKVEYSIFEIAYKSWDKDTKQNLVDFGKDIWLLELNDSAKETIDIRRIYNLCVDALIGQDIHYKSYLWWERRKDELAYGRAYFVELKFALHEYIATQKNEFDIRPFHLLVEFGVIMKNRVNFLVEKHYLKANTSTRSLLQTIEDYITQSHLIQNLCILYMVKNDIHILTNIKDRLSDLEGLYVRTLEKMLSCLEEKNNYIASAK